MRAALIACLPLAALGVLVPASVADSPARARAEAAIVTGDLGEFGAVDARGDAERQDEPILEEPAFTVRGASVIARASRTDGMGSARAVSEARGLSLLGGLVTASLARRTATATAGEVVYAGRVRDLRIGKRRIGDVETERRYPLPGGGLVVVNRLTTALRVKLGDAIGAVPGGTTIRVGVADADAADLVAATPRPTPTATPEPKQKPKLSSAAKARRRLTRGHYVFPAFGKASVADDFGAARQIGAHQGNDIFAPFGAPVLAVADGVVEKVGTLPISGNRLWLRTPAGDEFFYAHLSAFSPDAVDGHRVKAGTLLGFTGNTGDAEPTPPHVHFEIHPGGGDAIDPHAILRAWLENGDVPAGSWLARYGEDTAERPGALVEVRDFIAAN